MKDKIYVLLREFIYGLDTTEFGDDGQVITYKTKAEAQKSKADYIKDVNAAYKGGDMDSPYQKDIEIAEVEKVGNLFYNPTNNEYYKTIQR